MHTYAFLKELCMCLLEYMEIYVTWALFDTDGFKDAYRFTINAKICYIMMHKRPKHHIFLAM